MDAVPVGGAMTTIWNSERVDYFLRLPITDITNNIYGNTVHLTPVLRANEADRAVIEVKSATGARPGNYSVSTYIRSEDTYNQFCNRNEETRVLFTVTVYDQQVTCPGQRCGDGYQGVSAYHPCQRGR
jgi:hypothetical protein